MTDIYNNKTTTTTSNDTLNKTVISWVKNFSYNLQIFGTRFSRFFLFSCRRLFRQMTQTLICFALLRRRARFKSDGRRVRRRHSRRTRRTIRVGLNWTSKPESCPRRRDGSVRTAANTAWSSGCSGTGTAQRCTTLKGTQCP